MTEDDLPETGGFLPETADDVSIHRIAMEHFERALRALNAAAREIAAGREDAVRTTRDRSVEVGKAMQTLFDERKRADRIAGGGSDGPETAEIDLDEARRAIRRRLDRLAGEDPAQ